MNPRFYKHYFPVFDIIHTGPGSRFSRSGLISYRTNIITYMHKIFDLKQMDEGQLREIADGLKIRNARKMAKEDLVYRILDAEAVIDSQKEPEKPKRRGRPKKMWSRRSSRSRLQQPRIPIL